MPARAVISADLRHVRPQFAECEDSKACLADMWDSKSGTADSSPAKDLRQSNYLQYVCLKTDMSDDSYGAYRPACTKWVDCLKEQREPILNYLEAIGAPNAAALPQLAHMPAPGSSGLPLAVGGGRDSALLDSAPCSDPSLSDPETWDCDCHAQMDEACKGNCHGKGQWCGKSSFSTCYRALLCQRSSVCQSWKRAHCEGQFAAEADLEDSLGGKQAARLGWAPDTPTPSHSPVNGPADGNVCIM